MKAVVTILLSLFFAQNASSQNGIHVSFVPSYAGATVELEKYYPLPGGDSVLFETFKCYISDITFYKAGKQVWSEKESYHLLNAEEEETMSFNIQVNGRISYDEIHFNLGLDSATSTSGALGGDLDPAKGMFWTWQSGYINCKIEGKSSLCKTRYNEFQLHLGGYATPYNGLQHIELAVSDNKDIVIEIPLDSYLSKIDLRKQNAIMSPGKEAVSLAHKLAAVFEAKK